MEIALVVGGIMMTCAVALPAVWGASLAFKSAREGEWTFATVVLGTTLVYGGFASVLVGICWSAA